MAGKSKLTEKDKEYIKDHYGKKDTNKIAAHLAVSRDVINYHAKQLGIDSRNPNKGRYDRNKVTPEMIRYIDEHAKTETYRDIAEHLGLAKATVQFHAYRLGHTTKRMAPSAPEAHIPRKHTFKPGKKYRIIQPYSKDITGEAIRSSEKGGRCKEQSDMYRYEYSTTHLHFFRNKFGRMESFQDKRIGIDIKVREV